MSEGDKLINQSKPPVYSTGGGYAGQHGTGYNQATVVVQQPSPVNSRVHVSSTNDVGTGAMIFSLISTFIVVLCCCWWALPCVIVGLVLGIMSTNTDNDERSARNQFNISIGCSIAGLVAGIVVFIVVLGIVLGTNVYDTDPDNPDYTF